MAIFQQAQKAVGGLFDRINNAAQTPTFGLGIGFLNGNPQQGFQNAAMLAQMQQERQAQEQAMQQAQAEAQARAKQQQFDNNLGLAKYQLDVEKASKGADLPSLVREAQYIYPGDPAKQRAYLEKRTLKEGNGITFTTPDGSVLQVGGGGGAGGLGVKGKNDLDSRRINTADQLQRINQINNVFDEKFLKTGEKFNNLMLTIIDKGILPGDLTPEQQASVSEFAEFRMKAFNNLNQTLREMSGAAITPQESERLTKAMPNPGKGVFDGDSPTQFKSKMGSLTEQLKLAMARYNYASATGQVDNATEIVSLDGMKKFMNDHAANIEKDLRSQYPDASDDQIRTTVRTQMKTLFGNF